MAETLEALLAGGPHVPAVRAASSADALVIDRASTTRPSADSEGFWAAQAARCSTGSQEWDTILEWDLPFAKWFVGGQAQRRRTTASTATSTAGHGDQVAYHWEGEPGDARTITYAELLDEVEPRRQRAEGARRREGRPRRDLPGHGARAADGDARVRRGSAPRTRSCSAASPPTRCATASTTPRRKVLVTGDGAWRRGAIVAAQGDRRRRRSRRRRRIEHVPRAAAHRRRTSPMTRRPRRLVARPRAAAVAPSARPSRWTPRTSSTSSTRSGTTGKPKGIMHTTGGYLTQVAFTHRYVFDLHPDTDVYWCTADCRLGDRALVHRLRPAREPRDERHVRGHARPPRQGPVLVDRREVQGDDPLHRADRDPDVHEVGRRSTRARTTCRRCGCSARVGEPINPEAWVWYWQHIGGGRCPVVDTWWQTETGAIMISPLPGATIAQAGQRDVPAARASPPTSSTTRGSPVGDPGRRLPRARRGRGRRCCAASGATRSATARPTGRGSPAGTSPATAPSATTRATSGCSAGSTTSCSSPGHNISHDRGRVGARRPPRGRRGRGRRHDRRDDRPGDRRVRDPAGAATSRATRWSRSCATTSPSTSARSRSRSRSSSPRTCRRPAPARSCAGCCATSPRTRRSATRRRSPTRASSTASRRATSRDQRRPTSSAVPRAHAIPRSTGRWRDGPVDPGPRWSSTSTACCPTPRRRQHYIEAPRRDWQRASSTRAATTRSSRRCSVLLDLLEPTLRIVLLTARPHRVHHLTEAWLRRYGIRWDLLDHAAVGRLRAVAGLQAVDGVGAARLGFELRLALRGRPPQRRDVPRPRASPASTSTPATTTEQMRLWPRAHEQGTKRAHRLRSTEGR